MPLLGLRSTAAVPVQLVPDAVAVVRSRSSVSGLQGQTATFAVQLVVGGGAKRVELQGARLPGASGWTPSSPTASASGSPEP